MLDDTRVSDKRRFARADAENGHHDDDDDASRSSSLGIMLDAFTGVDGDGVVFESTASLATGVSSRASLAKSDAALGLESAMAAVKSCVIVSCARVVVCRTWRSSSYSLV